MNGENADTESTNGKTNEKFDWKIIIAALALFWTVVVGAGGLFRQHILADVAEYVRGNSEETDAKHMEFFRHIESEADGAVGRLAVVEQHCATIRDWRTATDVAITGLRGWANHGSQKLERLQTLVETQADGLRAAQAKLEKIEEKLERNGNGKR